MLKHHFVFDAFKTISFESTLLSDELTKLKIAVRSL